MLGKLISFTLFAIAIYAGYKWFGGDIGAFLSGALSLFVQVIDAGSDALIEALSAIFG